jgi:heme exporter protein A
VDEDLEEARRAIALVTHLPGLYEDLSARENLRILSRLAGRADESRAWLDAVGLEDRPDPVRGFSAGMRKRLSFARLLAKAPRIAFLDEPYGQLDPAGFDLVDRLLDELKARGATVVMASHLVQRAARACDRALLLDAGHARWTGPARLASRAWETLHPGGLPWDWGTS